MKNISTIKILVETSTYSIHRKKSSGLCATSTLSDSLDSCSLFFLVQKQELPGQVHGDLREALDTALGSATRSAANSPQGHKPAFLYRSG